MLWETFKARAQRENGKVEDVYQYEALPQKFRVQITQIVEEAFGDGEEERGHRTNSSELMEHIVRIIRKEFGVHSVSKKAADEFDGNSWWAELRTLILGGTDIEEVLSVVEILCFYIDRWTRRPAFREGDCDKRATAALEEINARFRQNAIGYHYVADKLIRIDSEYIHREAVIPAINVLHLSHYEGAKQEFLDAHQAHRDGDNSKAILEAAKSFESLMKAICDRRGWAYMPNATAYKLVEVCMQNGLVPTFWQTHFTGLRTMLESSVTTARNKLAGHGSGTTPVEIPDEVVPYVLHMTAATLLFLAEREAALP